MIARLVRGLTPPMLLALLRRARDVLGGCPAPEWEYVPEGWRRSVSGWMPAEQVIGVYREKWPAFEAALTSSRPLGINHEASTDEIESASSLNAHNLVVSFAYVVARAAGDRCALSVLDWGGGIGHYHEIARAVLPDVALDYHVRDLPLLVAEGRRVVPDATFHDDDSCLERSYDLVFASCSLHYSEDWRHTLDSLAKATGSFLYLTRVPLAFDHPSYVVLQRAQRHGYGTEYLGWVLNRDELLAAARDSGLDLVREFLVGEGFSAQGAPEAYAEHRGFLFRPSGGGG